MCIFIVKSTQKEVITMTLGEKIRDARKRLGFSQSQFCKLMNVTRQAVAKWEGDLGIPELPNLRILSNIFNMTFDEFLDESGKYAPLHITNEIDKKVCGKSATPELEILKFFYNDSWEFYSVLKFPYLSFLNNSDTHMYLGIKDEIKLLIYIEDYTIDIFELPNDTNTLKFEYANTKYKRKQKIDIYALSEQK